MITPRPKETLSNFRLTVSHGMSGWAAVLLVDVTTDKLGTYTDVQQTGIGRYRTRDEAITEAKEWAFAEELPFEL